MVNVIRFVIWSHRSAESIFGPSSSPVNRNGLRTRIGRARNAHGSMPGWDPLPCATLSKARQKLRQLVETMGTSAGRRAPRGEMTFGGNGGSAIL